MGDSTGKDLQMQQIIEKMKWEIAQELGIPLPYDGYGGHLPTRDCGKMGRLLQQRLPVILAKIKSDPSSVKGKKPYF